MSCNSMNDAQTLYLKLEADGKTSLSPISGISYDDVTLWHQGHVLGK